MKDGADFDAKRSIAGIAMVSVFLFQGIDFRRVTVWASRFALPPDPLKVLNAIMFRWIPFVDFHNIHFFSPFFLPSSGTNITYVEILSSLFFYLYLGHSEFIWGGL
jgi:hypothetical protein